MAISNFPTIQKVDPNKIRAPLMFQPQKTVAPLPTLWEFVQKKTGVKTELTPAPKILQTWAQALKQESKRIQETAKAVSTKKQQEVQQKVTPKFEMTRQDVVDAMMEKHPALSQALQSWEITQDDIFAASLDKYKAIKDMNNSGKIDNTQRVQEEVISKWPIQEDTSLLTKIWVGAAGIPAGIQKLGTDIWVNIWEKVLGMDMTRGREYAKSLENKIYWASQRVSPQSFETGKQIGKQVAITALTPWLWQLRWLWTLGKAAVWAWEWALATQVWSLLEKGKLASAKETGIWAAFWWVLRWASGIWQKWWSLQQTEALIMPKMTPSVTSERAAQWLSKTNMFGKVTYSANQREKEMAKAALNILRPRETISSNINRSLKALNSETDNLINVVKNSPVTYKTNDIIWRMKKIEKPLMIRWWENEAKYNAVIKKFEEILNRSEKTASWLLKARKEFDSFVNAEIPNLYTSDTMSPLKVAITKLRKVPNEWLNEKVWWDIVKNSLSKQNQLLDIVDNLSTKVESAGSTKFSRWIKNNPKKAWALKLAAIYWAAKLWLQPNTPSKDSSSE